VCVFIFVRILREEKASGQRRHESLIVSQKTEMVKDTFLLTMKVKRLKDSYKLIGGKRSKFK
jgi:hypothetical protein